MDVHSSRSWSNSCIFNPCILKGKIEDVCIGFPLRQRIVGTDLCYPSSSSFILKPWLIKPLSQQACLPTELPYKQRKGSDWQFRIFSIGWWGCCWPYSKSQNWQPPSPWHSVSYTRWKMVAWWLRNIQESQLNGDDHTLARINPTMKARDQKGVLVQYFVNEGAVS